MTTFRISCNLTQKSGKMTHFGSLFGPLFGPSFHVLPKYDHNCRLNKTYTNKVVKKGVQKWPKKRSFWTLFWPKIVVIYAKNHVQNHPKMGDFGCPGVPGQKWKNGSNLVLEWVARNDDPLQNPIVRGWSHFLVHGFWGSSRISSVKRQAMNTPPIRGRANFS